MAYCLVVALAAAGCSAIGLGAETQPDQTIPAAEQAADTQPSASRSADLAPVDGSVLEVLPASDTANYLEGERYLLSLAASPSGIPEAESVGPLRTVLARADDPNGNALIGERWYEPRFIRGDCAGETDQSPIPSLQVSYVPGEPRESVTNDQFALLEAPIVYSVQLSLFDTSEQRDSFAAVMRELAFYPNEVTCSMLEDDEEAVANLFPTVEEVPAIDIGHPGFGGRTEGLVGSFLTYQYSVGDHVLLLVSTGSTIASDDAGDFDVESVGIESFLRAQIAHLEAAGFG